MKVGFIGLPQSGKSTLFAAITGEQPDPYAQPAPRHSVVKVPDGRLDYLTELHHPKKVIEATIEFVDMPGVSMDGDKGQEEWRRLLPVIRQMDLLVAVVRDFEDPSVAAYRDRIDPKADFEAVWDELIFADLDAVTTRIERIRSALKKPTKTHENEQRELSLLERCLAALESAVPLSEVISTDEDRKAVSSFAFLTERPIVCVRNVGDDRADESAGIDVAHVKASLTLCASIEAEIAALDEADRGPFLADLGLEQPARDRLIRACYRACGLISFLTVGSDEVRAWTIRAGDTAAVAAGKIHTDLQRGFIRAETVAYDDLVAHTDMKGARAAGKVRKEGKTYVVADGDILNILAST
ncbi:MAG: redox-regulated ATPase YchF [Planctomycetes bacterium]|nr:redox-regulated ATPase YchF [Planctomycetota bacterium]